MTVTDALAMTAPRWSRTSPANVPLLVCAKTCAQEAKNTTATAHLTGFSTLHPSDDDGLHNPPDSAGEKATNSDTKLAQLPARWVPIWLPEGTPNVIRRLPKTPGGHPEIVRPKGQTRFHKLNPNRRKLCNSGSAETGYPEASGRVADSNLVVVRRDWYFGKTEAA